MKKEYDIINLHCGGCASKIQYELDRLENLKDVNVDFYTKKLKFTLINNQDESELLQKLNEIADKVEPGTYFQSTSSQEKFTEENDHNHVHSHGHSHSGELGSKLDLIILTVGVTLFVVGLTLPKSLQKDIILIIAYGLSGYDILFNALKNIKRGKVLDENFLMGIATVGALGLGDFGEAAGVMIFYKIGEFFQDMAVNNSKKSIEKLMSIKPEFANLKNKNGTVETVNPSKVNIGDILIVKPGEKVPLDGTVVVGSTTLDKSALTGESVPVVSEVGDEVLSGSINIDGTIEIKVTRLYSDSTVNKIIEMVQSAGSKKAHAEKFITKFARYYTPIVVFLAVSIGLGLPLLYDGCITFF